MNAHKPFIVIGAGGHANVVVDLLLEMDVQVIGLTDADPARHGSQVLSIEVIGGDEALKDFAPDDVQLALGLGASGDELVGALKARQTIALRLQGQGYAFPALVHPNASVGRGCEIADGAQLMAGAVVQSGSHIGAFAIVNSRASVDHDCHIGSGAHVGPGAALGGKVDVGESAYIGIGAVIVHGVTIGAGAVVGAGAAVIGNVKDGACMVGVPAKDMNTC